MCFESPFTGMNYQQCFSLCVCRQVIFDKTMDYVHNGGHNLQICQMSMRYSSTELYRFGLAKFGKDLWQQLLEIVGDLDQDVETSHKRIAIALHYAKPIHLNQTLHKVMTEYLNLYGIFGSQMLECFEYMLQCFEASVIGLTPFDVLFHISKQYGYCIVL